MTTYLAAQLSRIATDSNNSLNLKAQKAAHSKSLIFEPRVAASQSLETVYTLCHEGFQELCLLDDRFLEYQQDLFSEQSLEEDRTQMTAAQNSDLDRRIESFLCLVGSRIRLNPAIKAIEWLIRRFRIHEHSTSFLLTTFLPYHTLPVFTTLLSILPTNVPLEYRFLHPYIRSLTEPARFSIVQAATNNVAFCSILNSFVLRSCKARRGYPTLVAFWAGIMTEAVGGMMDKARSGRKGVQAQNEQDVILRLLPILNEGLALKKSPDVRIGCYMLLNVMASKGGMGDKLLTAMMEAVVLGWTAETTLPGLVCLSILAENRGAKQLTKRLTKELLEVHNLAALLVELSSRHKVVKFVNGLCLALTERYRRYGEKNGLRIIEVIFENRILSDFQVDTLIKSLVLVAHQLDVENPAQKDARQNLATFLVSLTQLRGQIGSAVLEALRDTDLDVDDLELKLHTAILPATGSVSYTEDGEIDDIGEPLARPSFGRLLEQLPRTNASETSFLAHGSSDIYPDLFRVFLSSTSKASDLDLFDSTPLLNREMVLSRTTYLSFYMKTWCGPYPVVARASALQMAARTFSTLKRSSFDAQGVLPYAIVALSDSAPRVRRAAAELIVAMNNCYPTIVETKKKSKTITRWASDDLYGITGETRGIIWLPVDVVARMLSNLLLPVLEECVLDGKHIESVFQKTLNSSNSSDSPKKSETGRLSQSSRQMILTSLASHAVNTPLFAVKLRITALLNQVRSIAGITRTKVLLPVLQQWASLGPSDVSILCANEKIDLNVFNDQVMMIVTPNDRDGLQVLSNIIKTDIAIDRDQLLEAAFKRLLNIWPSLKGDLRLNTAQMLLDSAQTSTNEEDDYRKRASQGSADLLRTATLSTDILLSFLDQLPTAAKLTDRPPANKRRRTSHGEVARAPFQDSKQLAIAIRKVTFVLQLVDSSEPMNHPELLKSLFTSLAELQHFKAQVTSELAYLQGLVLGSLLTILKAHKSDPNMKLNRSGVRSDLLVDCVQKSASPQVQNAALLLIASLAEIAPELVLHSVMPIFTFMGSSVLRQNDEYSAHVISQTIYDVIPPLISSLRKEKGDPVTGAAEILLSFVAAFEHVPPHRRQGLFLSLIQTLGSEDFLFALLSMLVDKYGQSETIQAFAAELTGSFSVEVQLTSGCRYIDLIIDVLKPKPTFSAILLGAHDQELSNPPNIALEELRFLRFILSQKRLVTQAAKLLDRDDMDAARVRDIYSMLLEKILILAEFVKDQDLQVACGDALESILSLLSTSEFVKSVESLLERPGEPFRRKILRSLEVRIDQESSSNAASRTAMLGFLPQLTAVIREADDVVYKHTAIACVDNISEKYGKKDIEAVAAAAATIAGAHSLGHSDSRLRVMSLLCLASLVEILQEGIVSILPVAIPQALDYMAASVKPNKESQKLHNAGFAFIGSLVHHLPYMISRNYLDRLLETSNVSAEAGLDEEADESRVQCLHLLAKQVDAKNIFGALEKNWDRASSSGPFALRENLDVLSITLDKHPKGTVTKYSSILAKIFHKCFDLKRLWSASVDERFNLETLSFVEAESNNIAIKMIYKLNDASFRPIFGELVEWASTGLPKRDQAGRILRLQSVFGFMEVFFDDLRSIVTSYATYIIESVVDVLSNVDSKDEDSKELWAKTLRTLVKCFKHDQDDFWQSPRHFSAVAPVLCAQFMNASTLPLIIELVPAIVELAAAADSPDHHKELNAAILKHLRSESGSVRLAAVKCQQALTDRVGEEWLSMLPEMLPFISELQEDDDDVIEKETHRWIVKIEDVLGESLDSMLQ